jgi:hypothetical protein
LGSYHLAIHVDVSHYRIPSIPLLTISVPADYGTKPLKDEEKYTGPIMGMPDRKEVLADNKDSSKKEIPYVLSGMVKNEQTIIGHGAIFNVPLGSGRLIAFTFDPLYRYLNLHDAVLVWNVLINWDYFKNP